MGLANKVLLLDGDTVQTVHVSKALYNIGHEVTVLCERRLSFGYCSRYPKRRIIGPRLIGNEDAFLNHLMELCKKESFDVLIPLYNDTADFVSKHLTTLKEYVNISIPEYDVFLHGYDKELTMAACERAGIPHPRTMNPDKFGYKETAEYVGFPALIKPNIAAGARGITRVENSSEFEEKFPLVKNEYGACTLQEFIPQTGQQIKAQMIRSADGQCSAASIIRKFRYFPVTGGSSCCNVTIDNSVVEKSSRQLLDEINWIGFADFDFIEDPRDGQFKVMEINPRVPACIGSAIISGLNFPKAIVDQSLGNDSSDLGSYTPGKILRFFTMECLWFMFSRERFRAKPSWFKFFGRDVYYQDGSLSDPLPMLAGVLIGLRKYADPKFFRAKFGGHKK
jgi:predicted ATP-grasp superfamily ATP-dependent carboligase